MSSALASLKRLSPSRITSSRCGGRSWRSTAPAAAASGGATMAPSATAAAHGRSGTSSRATTATMTMVRKTAPRARLAIGRQLARRSRGDASKAASTRTGATKSVSASSGSRTSVGVPGTSASPAPASATSAGYGAPMRREKAASAAPPRSNAMTTSKTSIILLRTGWLEPEPHNQAGPPADTQPARRRPAQLPGRSVNCIPSRRKQ